MEGFDLELKLIIFSSIILSSMSINSIPQHLVYQNIINMTKEEIKIEVDRINEISNSEIMFNGSQTGISHSENHFNHCWILNNLPNEKYNRTIKIDSFKDAIEIICLFSGNDKHIVEEGLRRNQNFDESKDMFLHYQKILKYL